MQIIKTFSRINTYEKSKTKIEPKSPKNWAFPSFSSNSFLSQESLKLQKEGVHSVFSAGTCPQCVGPNREAVKRGKTDVF